MRLNTTLIGLANTGRVIRQKYSSVTSIIVMALLLSIVVMSGCAPTAEISQAYSSENISNPDGVATPVVLYDENMLVSLYERAIPSVVKVEADIEKETETIGPFKFGPFQQKGQGSGFIIDEQGHILTNNHVVDGSSSVKVTLYKGNVFDAKVVGTDRENDLALLKVDPDKLSDVTPLTLGDSNRKRGEIKRPGGYA